MESDHHDAAKSKNVWQHFFILFGTRKVRMLTDNKKLLVYAGVLFLAVLLTYQFPYDTYMNIQHILMPIRKPGSGIQLEWIVIFALYIIGIRQNRERFFTPNWGREDITFKLMNENESISLIKRGW